MQQNSGRASLSNYGRRRRCCREEGGARALGLVCSSFSPLYIGPRERGRRSPCPFLQGRVRPRVGRSPSSPRHLGGAFPFRTLPFFLSLGTWASWGWCPWPI